MQKKQASRHHILYPELVVPDPTAFLDHLELEVKASKLWRLAGNSAPFRAVAAEFTGASFDGVGLAVVACVDENFQTGALPRAIMFAIMADAWGIDPASSRGATLKELLAAFALFRPLVRATCKSLEIACHITYPKDKARYALTAKTARLLDSFCMLANHSCLHPYDWERFYKFIRFCHAHTVRLSEGRLAVELEKRHLPKLLAVELADRYAFGRSLLKCSDDWH